MIGLINRLLPRHISIGVKYSIDYTFRKDDIDWVTDGDYYYIYEYVYKEYCKLMLDGRYSKPRYRIRKIIYLEHQVKHTKITNKV